MYHRRVMSLQILGPLDFIGAVFAWMAAIAVLGGGIYLWQTWDIPQDSGAGVLQRLQQYEIGNLDPANVQCLSFSDSVILLIANLPQLSVSLWYLYWNTQITKLWLEIEWRSFYCNRQQPRVTSHHDVPGTNESRLLILPYWLSVAMSAVGFLLHWLVSESLFETEAVMAGDQDYRFSWLLVGPLAMICTGQCPCLSVLR
jgi:hypothetical protein